jgi:signal transduction histidine kinase
LRKTTDLAAAKAEAPEQGARGARLGYADLRLEAAIFLLVAVSFAAVLGKSAITTQKLVLSPESGQFEGYTYSDAENGGRSIISADPRRPLSWSCEIREGSPYPYCGYGLQLDSGKARGLDFSHVQTIILRFSYRGEDDRLRLVLKTTPGPAARDKLKGEPMSLAADIPVVNGRNEIRLPLGKLAPEQWWVTSHGLSTAEAAPVFDDVRSVSIATSDAKAGAKLAVAVDDLTFEGSYLSTEQFYLIILGVWLVLSAGFLVFRFLRMRRDYEARQQRHTLEARLLAEAHAASEAASSAKSRFLGNMSHELRTPLNAIIGYTYWLNRTELDAKQRAAVQTVQASGEHLLGVISDLLDVAKIEAGKFDLLAAPFDLHDCVAGVSEMFRLPAEEKGLDFTATVGPDVPRGVEGDEKRIRQVLINLVGNAVKFTSAGRVDLHVSVVEVAGRTARLRFAVDDTGIGIPPDQLEGIFHPFEQAGEAADRSSGTGLGLSISGQIVALMGGDLRVESTLGQGSRFTVEIAVPIVEGGLDGPAVPRFRRLSAP